MIIGLDVGGTHTDVVLLDQSGLLRQAKIPTDPADLFRSLFAALEAVTAGVAPERIRRIVLSTTLTTNAVIQGNTPPVGLIVSAGPGLDPEAFRMGEAYVCVRGSIDHRGREIEPLDEDDVRRAADRFRREGIRQVGIVGKFSVRNPAHELAIRSRLGEGFDGVFLGHRVSGRLNFARRIATTYLNAAVDPLHRSFFAAVRASLAEKGLHLPLRLLKADGGNMKLEASLECPIQTVLSGPAASVMGAVAAAAGEGDAVVMDIGGTTTDLAVLIGQAPVLNPHGITIGAYRTLIRSLETLSIGTGGDSAVRVEDGRLAVGPERRGPAIVFGGAHPTPTDAMAALGILPHPARERAREALMPLAARLGLEPDAFARAVVDTACRQMLAAADRLVEAINAQPVYTVHELKEGYRVRPRAILVLGGPAPYFAAALQALTPLAVRVVPRWEVANAIGAALARTTCEVEFFADTERRIACAPAENFQEAITPPYGLKEATARALALLRAKALARGANPDFLEMEVVEAQEFNMIRGFHTTGKNLRVRVQVKPGLIHGYDALLARLAAPAEPPPPRAAGEALTPC